MMIIVRSMSAGFVLAWFGILIGCAHQTPVEKSDSVDSGDRNPSNFLGLFKRKAQSEPNSPTGAVTSPGVGSSGRFRSASAPTSPLGGGEGPAPEISGEEVFDFLKDPKTSTEEAVKWIEGIFLQEHPFRIFRHRMEFNQWLADSHRSDTVDLIVTIIERNFLTPAELVKVRGFIDEVKSLKGKRAAVLDLLQRGSVKDASQNNNLMKKVADYDREINWAIRKGGREKVRKATCLGEIARTLEIFAGPESAEIFHRLFLNSNHNVKVFALAELEKFHKTSTGQDINYLISEKEIWDSLLKADEPEVRKFLVSNLDRYPVEEERLDRIYEGYKDSNKKVSRAAKKILDELSEGRPKNGRKRKSD